MTAKLTIPNNNLVGEKLIAAIKNIEDVDIQLKSACNDLRDYASDVGYIDFDMISDNHALYDVYREQQQMMRKLSMCHMLLTQIQRMLIGDDKDGL